MNYNDLLKEVFIDDIPTVEKVLSSKDEEYDNIAKPYNNILKDNLEQEDKWKIVSLLKTLLVQLMI